MASLSDLARRIGATLTGAPTDALVAKLSRPEWAGERDISFLPDARFVGSLRNTSALGVIVAPALVDSLTSANALVVDDVMLSCARLANWLPVRCRADGEWTQTEVHPRTQVAASATLGSGVSIGEGTGVAAGVVVFDGARIGAYCSLGPGSVIMASAQLGNRVRVGPGAIVGEEGYAFLRDGRHWLRAPSFGGMIIGGDVEIGAAGVICRGVLTDTELEQGSKLDSHVLIGHDSRVGRGSMIAGHSAIAGAATIGSGCVIGGKVGIGEGVRIADGVTVTAMSMVTKSLLAPHGRFSSGWPAEISAQWWRRVGKLRKLSAGD